MKKLQLKKDAGISVICSTKREYFIDNILDNFLSQDYKQKELIIILNFNSPSYHNVTMKIKAHDNIQVFHQEYHTSLGQCLNYGISKSKHPVIAKFDDDDFYDSGYLSEMINFLYSTGSHIVGKSCIYVHFLESDIFAIQNFNKENQYVNRVCGSTLLFPKSILKYIKFEDINLGEDVQFCKAAIKKGFKIYSTSKDNYIYIRRSKNFHTWKMDNSYILNQSRIVSKNKLYKNYILRRFIYV